MNLPFELQPGESVRLFTRRHPIYFIARMACYTVLSLAPIAALTFVVDLAGGLSGTGSLVVALVDLTWFLAWLVRAYFTWYAYHNDVWVVTNQRVVDSTKRNWFNKRMASADLVDVEDIAVHKQGLLPTVFNFGDLQCQTAGERLNFVLAGIPDPTKVLALIDVSRDAARRDLRRSSG
jgi:hypothetical protein